MSNAEGRQEGPLNPQAIRLEDLVRILSGAGRQPVTTEMLTPDIEDGAPVNPDGTINVVHFVAWMVKEMGRGGD